MDRSTAVARPVRFAPAWRAQVLGWSVPLAVALGVALARAGGGAPWFSVVGAAMAWAGLAALLASGLLVWRSPWLAQRLGGWEAMVQAHHRLGLTGYLLVLVHPLWVAVAPVVGPALASPSAGASASGAAPVWAPQAWSTLWPWAWPAVTAAPVASPGAGGWHLWALTGWLALAGLMVGLAITFRPEWPYRRWRRAHLGMIGAVVLGVVHVLVLYGPSVGGVAAGVAALAVFGFRRGAVESGWLGQTFRVVSLDRPAPQIIEAGLQPEPGQSLQAEPGQFVLARFLDGNGYRACGEFHPFSISGTLPDGGLRVAIKALGPCTWRLQGLSLGVPVRLQGPFGRFLLDDVTRPQLWVAGGVGITPFMARLRVGPCTVPTDVLMVAPSLADAPFAEELRQLADHDPLLNLHIEVTGSRPAAPERLAAWLDRVPSVAGRAVHMCGPPGLLAALRPLLRARDVPDDAVHAERFDPR